MAEPVAGRRGGFWGVAFWAALVASLALNAFLIGGIVTYRTVNPPGAAPRGGGDLFFSLRPFWQELDPATRRELGRDLRAQRREIRELVLATASARRNILAAIRAEPFDPDAYRAALERASAADAALRGRTIDIMADYVGRLSPAERAAIAARIEDRLTRRAKGPRADPMGEPGDGPPPLDR